MKAARNIVIGAVVVLAVLAAIGSTVKPSGTGGSPAATAAPDLKGQVVFGRSIDSSAMTVAAPITTAKLTDSIGWVAYLSDQAKSTALTLTLASVTSGGAEAPVSTVTVDISNPQDNELAHAPDTTLGAALGAGTYAIRYIRPSDSTVLATGMLTLIP